MQKKLISSIVWANPQSVVTLVVLLLCCSGPVRAHGRIHHHRKHATKLKAWQFPHGLVVTYLPTPPSDLAELVDAHLWKFNLHYKRHTGFDCKLEWREDGKPPHAFAFIGAGPGNDSSAEVKIGLVPLGLSFERSSAFKWRMFEYCNDGSEGGSDGYENNPYKGPCFDIAGSNWAADGVGAIPLMVGWTIGDRSLGDSEVMLVLVVTTKSQLQK